MIELIDEDNVYNHEVILNSSYEDRKSQDQQKQQLKKGEDHVF